MRVAAHRTEVPCPSLARQPGAPRSWALAVALMLGLAPMEVPSAQAVPPRGAVLSRLLERLTAAARVASVDVRTARAARAAAQARRDAAGFVAPLALQASIADGPKFNVGSGNVQLDVTRGLFTGARQAAERGRADVELGAAAAELLGRERAIEMEVVRAVARTTGAARIIRRLERSGRLLGESEDALRARFATGDARYLDVLRLRTERLQARSDLASARAEWAGAVARLELLVSAGIDSAQLAAVLDSASGDALAAGWPGVLAARVPPDSLATLFPGVRAAIASEARARAGVVELRAAQQSQVSANAGVQRIGPANGPTSLGAVLGISATLPFTARASNVAAEAAAASAVEAAQAAHASATANARASIRAGRARYQAAIERLESFDAGLLEAAENERETAIAQYRSGALPLLDLLDFERALQRVEVARMRAVIDAADALAILHGLPATAGDLP